jgi:hypothetical protein
VETAACCRVVFFCNCSPDAGKSSFFIIMTVMVIYIMLNACLKHPHVIYPHDCLNQILMGKDFCLACSK